MLGTLHTNATGQGIESNIFCADSDVTNHKADSSILISMFLKESFLKNTSNFDFLKIYRYPVYESPWNNVEHFNPRPLWAALMNPNMIKKMPWVKKKTNLSCFWLRTETLGLNITSMEKSFSAIN